MMDELDSLRRVIEGAIRDGCVTCPEPGCGFNYMHPIGVAVNRGGEITTVTAEGTKLSAGSASGRGVEIVITFLCENGHHRSRLMFQFNKGNTGVTFKSEGEHDREGPASTVWRD